MEIIGPNAKSKTGILMQAGFSVGYATLSGLALWLTEWRWLHRSFTIQIWPHILLILWLFESPRWLLSKNRVKEASDALLRIARWNNVKQDELVNLMPEELGKISLTMQETEKNVDKKIYSQLDLFRNGRQMIKVLSISCFLWWATVLSYYGLSLGAASFPGSVYITNALFGAVEIPSYILTAFLMTSH